MKTELTICSLPACERKREVLTSLLSHLLTKGRKSSTFGLVVPRGSPKYVKGRFPVEQPKVAARCCNLSVVILIGTSIDFDKFTLKPVESAKMFRRAFSTKNCLAHPSVIMRVSSAY